MTMPIYDIVRAAMECRSWDPIMSQQVAKRAAVDQDIIDASELRMSDSFVATIERFIEAEEAAYWASEKAKTRAGQQKVLHARRLKLRAAMRAGQRGRFAA